jgi:UDP-glucose 4-epimerase
LRCLVTGVAGFIGSKLADELIKQGHRVVGVDCFTEYYPRSLKEANLAGLCSSDRFKLMERNLLDAGLYQELEPIECIFHLAAQAGVRGAWGSGFRNYVENNIMATQILLEAVKGKGLKKLVYASSSSVYGQAETYPTPETVLPLPMSPYGTTKLAAERLCYAYHKNYEIPAICLRYFTVYGPRQRPDMAFARFIKSMIQKETITVYGDGTQTRDFTYVDDIVRATILAAESDYSWEIFNVGGATRTTITRIIHLLEKITGNKARAAFSPVRKGDVHDTCADVSRAKEMLGYTPSVGIEQGLASEVKYFQDLTSTSPKHKA